MTNRYEINKAAKMYQVISRDNDINGNPYRLIILYDADCLPVQCFEARSSTPNIDNQLYGAGYPRLLNIHVQPKEYNRIKRAMGNFSTVENGIEFSH